MRTTAVLVSLALVFAAVAMVPLGGLAAGDGPSSQQTDANESAADVAPGQRLGGVVAVGQTELESDVEVRAFNRSVAGANTPEARADMVREQLRTLETRFERLQERKQALDRARANESLGEGAYRARVAELAASLGGTERVAAQTERVAAGLDPELRAERGIDVEAIHRLREQANEMRGQDVAEIARDIAGPSVGNAPGHAGPDDRGSPAGTDRPSGSDAGSASPGGNQTAGPDTGTEKAD